MNLVHLLLSLAWTLAKRLEALGYCRIERARSAVSALAGLIMRTALRFGAFAKCHYTVRCFDAGGNLKWVEAFGNLVVDEGLDDILDKYFKGSAYTAAHYIGLKGTGAVAAGDTMAAHAGWSELTPYSNATRPAYTTGAVSGQSIDNSGAVATFTINATATVVGAFLSTDGTKGGTAGTLFGGGDFAASRNVESNDTLEVTITATQAAV